MEVHNFRITETDAYLELACDALSETATDGEFTIWYRFPPDCREVGLVAEPFLAALLVPCMRQKEDLKVHAAVSARLLKSLDTIMDIFAAWNSTLSRISIEVDETYEPSDIGDHVGCFFSGGVDSFYSLLKNMAEHSGTGKPITDLIQMRGLDLGLEPKRDALWNRILNAAEEVAEKTGKRLLPVVTNVKVHTDQYTSWGRYPPGDLFGPVLHGALLASVGLCLSRGFHRIMIPSSYDYAHLFPWGSHPLLDPLWSTGATEFVHDGCESSRHQKIVLQVAGSQIAMQHLRVCWSLEDYNCGKCEKCLRTMISLDIAGTVDRCRTFNPDFSLEDCKRLDISEQKVLIYWEELLAEARKAGRDDLLRKIKYCLRTPKTVPRRIKREFERFYRNMASLGKKG